MTSFKKTLVAGCAKARAPEAMKVGARPPCIHKEIARCPFYISVARVGLRDEINTATTGDTDCRCGWCASTDFLVCRVGQVARWSRRYPRNLSNARRFDLSDHLLDCRRSLPQRLFRVDVRRLVRGLVEAGLTGFIHQKLKLGLV